MFIFKGLLLLVKTCLVQIPRPKYIAIFATQLILALDLNCCNNNLKKNSQKRKYNSANYFIHELIMVSLYVPCPAKPVT